MAASADHVWRRGRIRVVFHLIKVHALRHQLNSHTSAPSARTTRQSDEATVVITRVPAWTGLRHRLMMVVAQEIIRCFVCVPRNLQPDDIISRSSIHPSDPTLLYWLTPDGFSFRRCRGRYELRHLSDSSRAASQHSATLPRRLAVIAGCKNPPRRSQ